VAGAVLTRDSGSKGHVLPTHRVLYVSYGSYYALRDAAMATIRGLTQTQQMDRNLHKICYRWAGINCFRMRATHCLSASAYRTQGPRSALTCQPPDGSNFNVLLPYLREHRTIWLKYYPIIRSWDSSIGIATGYYLDDRNSIPGRSNWCFCSPQPFPRE
jgi:hypothetical protein